MNRKLQNYLFEKLMVLATLICGIILIFLLGIISINGISSISFDFIFTPSSSFGAKGGIIIQILGSLLLVSVAAILSFPIGLGVAIFKSEYLKNKRWQKISTILIFSLNGIPSVIFGIFGLIFFVNYLHMGVSWLVGSIILAMMILPTIILAAYQSINTIPRIYRENAYALGLNKWQTITKVLLPQGISGAITGLLMGMARIIGETAPIMFIATAYSGVRFPQSFSEPVSALPTHILALAQQATNPVALRNAWGTSFILIVLVVLFSISALTMRLKINNYNKNN